MQSSNKQNPKRRRRLIYLLVGCLIFIFVVLPAGFLTGLLISIHQENAARPAQVITPNVIGQEYRQGEALLKSKGLNMQVRARRADRNQPGGIIVDQTPRVGESIPANYTVSVVLSDTPK